MIRRIRRPEQHSDLLSELVDRDDGVFDTYKDALIFAAAFGAYVGRRESFEKVAEPIDYQIFARHADQLALFDALAVYDREDIEVLSAERTDERLTIFEEYANGGLSEIKEARAQFDQPLQDVVQRLIGQVRIDLPRDEEDDGYRKVMEEIGAGYRPVGK